MPFDFCLFAQSRLVICLNRSINQPMCDQYKVWLKQSAEMSFLYGNNVMKSGLARITEGTPQYAGVVVYNLADIPLGFGVAAQTTDACKELAPTANVVLHQADVGEFLRGLEDDMF